MTFAQITHCSVETLIIEIPYNMIFVSLPAVILLRLDFSE